MKFEYYAGDQRTPEWYKLRLGKVTASRLEDWLAVGKRDGKPLKARLDYERELLFERTFNTSYENFVSSAMQEGIDFEDFARQQYNLTSAPLVAEPCGMYYNDHFCASPDAHVGKVGLLEIKILKDNSFTEVLTTGVPPKHWKQMQGQLWVSGRKWCDYVAVNLNSHKMKVIRVTPDADFHKQLEESVVAPLTNKFDTTNLYTVSSELPEPAHPLITRDFSDSNIEGF